MAVISRNLAKNQSRSGLFYRPWPGEQKYPKRSDRACRWDGWGSVTDPASFLAGAPWRTGAESHSSTSTDMVLRVSEDPSFCAVVDWTCDCILPEQILLNPRLAAVSSKTSQMCPYTICFNTLHATLIIELASNYQVHTHHPSFKQKKIGRHVSILRLKTMWTRTGYNTLRDGASSCASSLSTLFGSWYGPADFCCFNISNNRTAWQWAETLVEIRGTLVDIRGTTK